MKLLDLLIENLEEATLSKPLILGKEVVDKLRSMNSALDAELNDPIYNDSSKGVFAKGGAARLGLLLYKDLLNGTSNHAKDVVRDQDFVWILSKDQLNKAKTIPSTIIDGEPSYGGNRGGAFNDWGAIASKLLTNPTIIELINDESNNVEVSHKGFTEYFNSRDFTINQALINREQLIISRKALRDVDKKLINPVKGIMGKDSYYDYANFTPRLYYRMALFAARYGYDMPSEEKFATLVGSSYNSFFKNKATRYDYYIPVFKAYELGIEDKFFDIIGEKDTYDIIDIYFISLGWLRQNKSVMDNMKGSLLKALAKHKINKDYNKKQDYDSKITDDYIDIIYSEVPELKKEVDNLTVTMKTDLGYYDKAFKKLNRLKSKHKV